MKKLAVTFFIVFIYSLSFSQTADCIRLFNKNGLWYFTHCDSFLTICPSDSLQTKKCIFYQCTDSIFTGTCKSYVNGKTAIEESYKNGIKCGTSKYYYDNGLLYIEERYIIVGQESVLDGASITYFENGNIQQKINFKKGVLHGVWYEKDVNGKIIGKGKYKKGKLIKGEVLPRGSGHSEEI